MLGFMVGNRDFLVGAAMLDECGAVALPDPTVLIAFGQRLLLSHGDALCLADIDYQSFRAEVRTRCLAETISGDAARPAAQRSRANSGTRAKLASTRRPHTNGRTSTPPKRFDGCKRPMHRCSSMAIRIVRAPTRSAPGFVRHVLSDWDLEQPPGRAQVLRLNADGLKRVSPSAACVPMIGAWRRFREARALRRRAIPDALWNLTLARFPFLARRDEESRAELRRLSTLFLASKEFSGAQGFEVTDEVAVAIAAQACVPVLRLGLHWYAQFVGIVVHSDEVRVRREVTDETGVVHRYTEVLSGEAMEGGPMMLSWRDVESAGDSDDWAYNVVIHEFAHVIDMRDGAADGVPPLPDRQARSAWLQVLQAEFGAFQRKVDADEQTVLDPYGASGLDEFFAVASESFFVSPRVMRAEHPALYELLRGFFRQDPATQ